MAAFAWGLGMIFSSMTNTKDLSFLLTFGIQLYMYTQRYPLSACPKVSWLVKEANPLTEYSNVF
jgi:ABC-type polysaccharide/polyol phosphate export permease